MGIEALSRQAKDIRLLRYLVVGGLLFLIDLCIVYSLVRGFAMNPGVAQLFGRTTGAAIGFFLHRNFTYHANSGQCRVGMVSQGGGYLLLGISTTLVSPFILLAFLELLNNHLVFSKVLTEFVIVVWNYLAMMLVFNRKEDP